MKGNYYGAEDFDINKFEPDGYNDRGRDMNGFNRKGINFRGFNKEGIHQNTKTRYNEKGQDIYGCFVTGYDTKGYNRYGFNAKGLHRDTITLYNLEGYNQEGYDINGLDKTGYSKEGLDIDGKNINGIYDRKLYTTDIIGGNDKAYKDLIEEYMNSNKARKEFSTEYGIPEAEFDKIVDTILPMCNEKVKEQVREIENTRKQKLNYFLVTTLIEKLCNNKITVEQYLSRSNTSLERLIKTAESNPNLIKYVDRLKSKKYEVDKYKKPFNEKLYMSAKTTVNGVEVTSEHVQNAYNKLKEDRIIICSYTMQRKIRDVINEKIQVDKEQQKIIKIQETESPLKNNTKIETQVDNTQEVKIEQLKEITKDIPLSQVKEVLEEFMMELDKQKESEDKIRG